MKRDEKKRDEKKLYQLNKLSYNLVMLFIILNTAHAIFTLQNMAVDYSIGFFIMITIIISMLSFLTAVKLQTYSKAFSYVALGIGVLQLVRFVLSPPEIEGELKVYLTILILGSIVFMLAGGMTSMVRATKRSKYLKHEYKGNEAIH